MSGYERPSEKGKSKTVVSFWAELWRPMTDNVHGEAKVSPKFGTQSDLTGWLRENRKDGDEIFQWKRTSYPDQGTFDDEKLMVKDVPMDPERLHGIVADLKKMLEAKKRELDKPFAPRKPYARVSEFNPIERPLTYEEVYEAVPVSPQEAPE